ncbi:MAG: hypothetical protein WKH64_13770 [Chloroflexia bacterium]
MSSLRGDGGTARPSGEAHILASRPTAGAVVRRSKDYWGAWPVSHQIKFGTDGWRAVIAQDYTFENVRLVSQALRITWRRGVGEGPIIVATRDSPARTSPPCAEVLAGNGVRTFLTQGATPTPPSRSR